MSAVKWVTIRRGFRARIYTELSPLSNPVPTLFSTLCHTVVIGKH